METSLAQYLITRPSVTDYIGQRIYSYYAPDHASYPYIIYRVVSSTHSHDISYALGVMRCRIQLDLVSDDLNQIEVLRELLRHEIDGYQGPMADTLCIKCKLVNEVGFVNPPEDNSDTHIYRRAVDYHIRYKIALPSLGVAGASIGSTASVTSSVIQSAEGGLELAGQAEITVST